jgi:hypothetical protein
MILTQEDIDNLDQSMCGEREFATPYARAVEAAVLAKLQVPTEAMWGELARDIVMWMDMHQGRDKTPARLFRHLNNLGREIPQWLLDESEMKNLDHVPSKGTRAVIVYKAMLEAAVAK